jgi:N-acyl-L-homoserine lactone synthetase
MKGRPTVLAIFPEHRAHFTAEITAMHQLRYRVFHERLGWEVTTVGDMELDHYDIARPIYLVHLNADGVVDGCVRMLPTTGSNMLAHTFPALLDGQDAPCAPTVWESSRFAVDTPTGGRDQVRAASRVTLELFAAAYELGVILGWTEIVTVTDLRVEKLGRAAGLQFERFGPPLQIGKTQAVAGRGPVSPAIYEAICAYGGIDGSVLETSYQRLESEALAA